MHLRCEPIARVVEEALFTGERLGHYELGAFAIMSNHVHLLLLPKIAASRVLQSLKGATARQANLILGRTGETFWQTESYDHWIRDDADFAHCVRYTEENPVKARLCAKTEDWPWSSAAKK